MLKILIYKSSDCLLKICACEIITPLDNPVVPDVHNINAICSSAFCNSGGLKN